MEIKRYQVNEEAGSVSCGAPSVELEARLQQFLEYRSARAENLFAMEGERCVGTLYGIILPNDLYEINSITTKNAGDFERVGGALLEYALKNNQDRQIESAGWNKEEDVSYNMLVHQWGFYIHSQKVFVHRALVDFRNPYRDPFVYRNFFEAGKDAFVAAIAKVNAHSMDGALVSAEPETELNELIEQAASAFDGSRWQLAYLNGELAGLVFPQLYIGDPDQGTIFHVGVSSEYRGQGWGKILHAKGLDELRRAGAAQYVGCTDVENVPMLQAFKANGCKQKGVRQIYRLK